MDNTIESILANPSDLYGVLHVENTADAKTIRKSYYKLSLKLHPDKNPSDQSAHAAYKVVVRAYEILSDPAKRQVYDAHGASGIDYLERGGEMPSMKAVLTFFLVYISFVVIRSAAARCMLSEELDRVFPWSKQNGAGGEAADSSHTFEKMMRKERKRDRRFVMRIVSCTLTVVLLVAVVHAVDARTRTQVPSAPPAPGTAYDVLIASSAYTQSLADYRSAPVAVGVNLQCAAALLKSGGRRAGEMNHPYGSKDIVSFRKCHSQKADGKGSDDVVLFNSFGGGELDVRLAVSAFLKETCDAERMHLWASRERYERTATIRRTEPLPEFHANNKISRGNNVNNNNSTASGGSKRVYPIRRWRPKFVESFTVQDESELFSPTPHCARLWDAMG